MRKNNPQAVAFSYLLLLVVLLLSFGTTNFLIGPLDLGDFKGIAFVAAVVFFIYFFAILFYRAFLRLMPLKEGEVPAGSREEFVAHVHILFFVGLFNSLIRTHFIPLPLMRPIYLALGARIGRDSYSAGSLLDPPLTIIGDNSIIGHDAVLFAHAIEGEHYSLKTIRIGNHVTVGAHAIVMSGVTIEDGAMVSAGAVVLKDTHIGPRELWGGMPARLIKHLDAEGGRG